MRNIGNVDTGLQSTAAPTIVFIVYDTATHTPQTALTQVSNDDLPGVFINGVVVPTESILEQVEYKDTRPQQKGGLHRHNISFSIAATSEKGYPYYDNFPSKGFYQATQNPDDFYFSVYVFDRTQQFKDVRNGLHLGCYKLDQSVTWNEQQGLTSFSIQDVLTSDLSYVGTTDEVIPDFFFLYNQWYGGGIIPKVYGQVPRVRMLNAFPSFSVKRLANSINGIVGADYTAGSSEIILEENVDQFSVLKQLAQIGGVARVRMLDGEVIAGTLVYDSGANHVKINSLTRNTYYREVQAYMDSGDGNTPDKWPRGPAAIDQPNYSTVDWKPGRTVIPNSKELLLGDTGYLQADINFFDTGVPPYNYLVTDCFCKVLSLPSSNEDDKTKQNVVIHEPWPDDRFSGGTTSVTSTSAFFDANSNSQVFPVGTVVQWGVDAFEYMKFYDTARPVRLFFNPPTTAVGGGSEGDGWTLVGFEPTSIDYSCYLRNGFSTIDEDHVYCQGEGRLIKIPTGNIVSVSSSTTEHGLSDLMRVELNMAPLDMNIGATSNDVYVDCLYSTADALDNRTERVIVKILESSPLLTALAGTTLTDTDLWSDDPWLPFTGWVCREETPVWEIIDRFVFQCGINLTWVQGKFEFAMGAINYGLWEEVTIDSTDYIKYLGASTDTDEMIENSASLTQGHLVTESSGNFTRVPLLVKLEFGGWDDPYYQPSRNFEDRTVSNRVLKFEYKFDLINDTHNFAYAGDLMMTLGHAAGLNCCERQIKVDMGILGLRWESMDPILFRDFPLLTSSDVTDAVFDPDGDPTLPLYEMPASGKPDRLCGGIGLVDSVSITFGSDGAPSLVNLIAKVAQLKVFPRGWGGGGGVDATPPGKPPTLPENPNLPPSVPAGFGPVPQLPGFDVGFSPAQFENMEIDSLDNYSQNITITINGNLIFDRGFPWTATIIDTDLTSDGAWLTGDTGGTIPTPTTVTLTKTLTLNINYRVFSDFLPLSRGTREVTVRFDLYKDGPETEEPYIERIYRKCYITRVLPEGIDVE